MIPSEAVEAAARALIGRTYSPHPAAKAALDAALPHIRAMVIAEIVGALDEHGRSTSGFYAAADFIERREAER